MNEPIEISINIDTLKRAEVKVMVPGDETIYARVHPVAGIWWLDADGREIEELVPNSLKEQMHDELSGALRDLRYIIHHMALEITSAKKGE